MPAPKQDACVPGQTKQSLEPGVDGAVWALWLSKPWWDMRKNEMWRHVRWSRDEYGMEWEKHEPMKDFET
jgi:hypothetical protein